MITLPKMIGASGNDCVVATVTMVCMYWRQAKENLPWNLPLDFDHKNWTNFFESGRKFVRMSGMPFNNIKHFLKKLNLPLSVELEFLEDMYGLRNLVDHNIPPIVLYDHTYFMKNVRGPGHAVVLIDQTDELFVSVNPSLEPKFYHKLAKTDFEESWKLNHNATIIIHPKTYKLEVMRIPTKTLMNYINRAGTT
jgi:hypothetical protein